LNYGDYTEFPQDPRTVRISGPLPIYGDSFFRWVRQTIEIRRNSLMQMYAPERMQGASEATSYPRNGNRSFPGATGEGTQNRVNALPPGNVGGLAGEDTEEAASYRRMQRGGAAPAAGLPAGVPGQSGAVPPPTRSVSPSNDTTDQTIPTDNTANIENTPEASRAVQTQEDQRRAQLGFGPAPQYQSGRYPYPNAGYPNAGYSNTGYSNTGYYGPNGGQPLYDRYGRPLVPSDEYVYSNAYAEPGQALYPAPVDAFRDIADPITQLYRNVIASVPANYQLWGGDRLTIRYSSPTLNPREFLTQVDSQGSLNLFGVGRILVRGMTLAQAETAIRNQLSRVYKSVEVSVSLKELRTIQVTVGGQAYNPGTYTVPATVGVFNVLYAAGGPAENGSLRRIEVRRNGRTVGALDFYRFLLSGNQGDIPLQTGDLIFIPPNLPRIALEGDVRNNALYEIKEGETLQDLLRYAGGIKPSGVEQYVQVNTFDPGKARLLKSVNVRDAAAVRQIPLYDGDIVDVFSLRPIVQNKVTVEGAVEVPGDYGLVDGMRVSDLIQRAHNPISDAYLARAELYRWNSNNTTTLIPIDLTKALVFHDPNADLTLQRWDRLHIYTQQEVAWVGQRKVTVRGPVQRPGIYEFSANMHVSDLLLKAGGPLLDAYMQRAVLQHQNGDGTFSYDYISLAAIKAGDKTQDLPIRDNDILAVYRVGEASFTPEHIVTLRGEVNAPGLYPRGEDMKLSDLIKNAGGFKPNASANVVVAHARQPIDGADAPLKTTTVSFDSQIRTTQDIVLEDGDVVTVQGIGGFQDKPAVVIVKGAVQNPGPIVLTRTDFRLSDAIKAAGGLRPESYPPGTEFFRDSRMVATVGQRDVALQVSQLNNLLNTNAYNRELAKSDVDRIKAVNASTQSSSYYPFGAAAAAPSPSAAALTQLFSRDLVSKPRELQEGNLRPNGNVAVNLLAALQKPGGPDDVILVDGDTINVPNEPTMVQVVGAVVNPRGVVFKPGAGVDYYVTQTGGYAPDAAKDRIVIIHTSGGLIPANKVKSLEPGDVILVPTKVLAAKLSNQADLLNTFFQGLVGAVIAVRLATTVLGL
jgi:protein involved in polysaccharide export with SLBB domain